jgi:hypothetical protein
MNIIIKQTYNNYNRNYDYGYGYSTCSIVIDSGDVDYDDPKSPFEVDSY